MGRLVTTLVVLALLCISGHRFAEATGVGGPGGRPRPLVTLPLEFDVLPENRLYLNGERIYRVEMTTAPGDTLYLNGVPIKPVREREFSRAEVESPPAKDAKCLKLYGDVPYVKALMDTGVAPREATALFFGEQRRIWRELDRAYDEALSTGESIAAAGRAAFAKLRELDRECLIDWERRPEVALNCVRLFWKGRPSGHVKDLGRPPAPEPRRMPSEVDKQYRATMIYEAVAVRTPCWCLIGAGGFAIYCGEEDLSRIRSELDAVLRDRQPRHVYLLGEAFAREILERQLSSAGD